MNPDVTAEPAAADLQALAKQQQPALMELSRSPDARFALQSDLLYELMTFGDGLQRRWPRAGNWNQQNGGASRAVLTWLVMRALGVERLPWHHDRVFSGVLPQQWEGLVDALRDQSELEEATEELQDLHEHTLNTLHRYGLQSVVLARGIDDVGQSWGMGVKVHGYASKVARMAAAAARLGREAFEVPIDVLSSWSVGGYGHLPVTMQCEVPAESIGWASWLIASRDPGNPQREAVEGGEWVILGRDPGGRLRIPTMHVSTIERFFDPYARSGVRMASSATPEQMARLARLKVDPTLHPSSDSEAEEILRKGAMEYGPMSSCFDDRPNLRLATLQMPWSQRLRRAAQVLIRGKA